MENVTDLSQFSALPFLKVSEVKDGDKLIVLSSTKKETNKWGKEVLTFYGKHNDQQKIVSINTRSPQVAKLVAILGMNPLSWIGQTITLKKVKVNLSNGKEVQALEFLK